MYIHTYYLSTDLPFFPYQLGQGNFPEGIPGLNTPAADMGDSVPMHIRKERNEILRQLSEKKKRAFYEQHLGQERIVLVEQSKNPERLTGFTDNYIKVELSPSQGSVNGLVSVSLNEINERGLVEVGV